MSGLSGSASASVIGVSVAPGARATTRIPLLRNSGANEAVKCASPALVAA